MPLSLKYLPTVIKSLEEHPEALRLKKIVFCISKKTWVNDIDVLNSFSLNLLLQEVFLTNKTFPEVIYNAYQVIKSINRREIYVGLAKYLLEKLKIIYSNQAELDEDSWIIKGINVRELNLDDLLDKEEQSEQEDPNGVFINVMEIMVNEEIFNELKKIPLNIAKYMKPEEIAAYALNRLPPLYASSEQGRRYQNQKIERFKDVVHAAVMQGIGAVMRDPIRKSTPLNVSVNNVHTEAYHVLMKLQKIVNKQDLGGEKATVNDLADKILKTIESYDLAFTELSNFLRWYGLSDEKITAENLVAVVRKILRKQAQSNINQLPNEEPQKQYRKERQNIKSLPRVESKIENKIPQKNLGKETQIIDFSNIPDIPDSADMSDAQEEESDDMQTIFSTSVRDWYTF